MRVATYNVLHCLGIHHGRVDLEAVADTIASLDCDAVAVQEVDRDLARTGHVDQVGRLADRLGWHGVFAPALLGDPDRAWRAAADPDPGGPAFGIGLLARSGLTDVRHVRLPGGGDGQRPSRPPPRRLPGWPGWDREPRTALAADVTADGRRIRLVTAHLSYLPWRAAAQLRVAAHEGRGPRVLLGDLNLPLLPARAALGPRWTAGHAGPTYPVWRPRVQVDQIHVTGGLVLEDVARVATGPSDHFPVRATVTG